MRSHISKIAPFTSQPATLGWIRHNIPHLPLQNIPHHTKFHITPCDTWLWWYYKYVVWCAVIVVRCSKPYHILLHAIIPHHIAPVPLAAHCSTLQYLISNRTIATCIAFGTPFHIITDAVPWHKPHSMTVLGSHHILATSDWDYA